MKAKVVRVGLLAVAMLAVMVFGVPPSPVKAATTYTWNQTGSASWALSTNWTPTRTTPATDDILVIDGSSTASPTLTNIPTQTIGQLLLTNSTNASFTSAAASVLTVGGGTGTDFQIDSGSALTLGGTSAIQVSLSTGATGNIAGSMTVTGAPHRLLAADASAITFNSGAIFTQTTGFTGSVFGTTGTANVIVFASGSTFVFQAGSNPFGLGQPSSKVVFQSGSLYRHESTNTPSFSGRKYANFELNYATANVTGTGSNPLAMDSITITLGTLNLQITGTVGITITGNIQVASGQTLNFNPTVPATVTLKGTTAQTIGGAGALTFGTNEDVTINNSNGVTLTKDITLQRNLALTSGDLNTGSNTLTLASGATITAAGDGDVIGNVRRSEAFSAGPIYTFNNPNTLVNFSSVTLGPSPTITMTLTKGSVPDGLSNAVTRGYTVTVSDISPFTATLRLRYKTSELGSVTEANIGAFKREGGGRWTLQTGSVDTVNHFVTVTDTTSFSEWALTDNGAPTAVTVSNFTARSEEPPVLGVLAVLGTLLMLGVGAWQIRGHRS